MWRNLQPLSFCFRLVLMISILIPIYNQNVLPLVQTLTEQIEKDKPEDYEIICADDHSEQKWHQNNKDLATRHFIEYMRLPSNMGRSRIRNYLATHARHGHLLFLDGDSMVEQDDFLVTYRQLVDKYPVIVGGRKVTFRPTHSKLRLHWKYSVQRESKSLGFISNNFLIRADVFEQIKFDETLVTYGHEDTLFGYCLEENNIPVLRIDNPTTHGDLDCADQFLQKQRLAIKNLLKLRSRYPTLETRLSRAATSLGDGLIRKIVCTVLYKLRRTLEWNLLGSRPSLLALDLYKLSYYLMPEEASK